jgi:hypothetical protein
MHHPADGTLANLAFILTPRGFHWFQKQLADIRQVKPLEHPLETLRLARVQLNKQIEEMRHELSQTCSHFGLNTGTLAADFDHYLDGSGPERARDLLKFWNVEADSESRLFDFAKIAWQLLQIPASESTAERAFSVLEALFPRCRAVSNAKLLEAELRIRLEQIYDKIMERTHHNEKKRE